MPENKDKKDIDTDLNIEHNDADDVTVDDSSKKRRNFWMDGSVLKLTALTLRRGMKSVV
jgi:hypothetical protein